LEEIKLHDQNIILLSVYVGYRISDPTNFFTKFLNGSIPVAESVLNDLVRSSKLKWPDGTILPISFPPTRSR
jgi:regulator of protease activity HflC (stomatin/prohibitin superfamily)